MLKVHRKVFPDSPSGHTLSNRFPGDRAPQLRFSANVPRKLERDGSHRVLELFPHQ